MKKLIIIAVLSVVFMLMQSCSPQPTQTPYPTNTPQPTYTEYPTLTAFPTYTKEATQTPNPTYTAYPTLTPYPTYTQPPTSTPTQIINTFCETQKVDKFTKEAALILSRWVDNQTVAGRTSRGALIPVIQDMQQIKREVEAMETPPCLEDARSFLRSSMINGINAFMNFVETGKGEDADNSFKNATYYISKYSEEVNRIRACAPNCSTPTPKP